MRFFERNNNLFEGETIELKIKQKKKTIAKTAKAKIQKETIVKKKTLTKTNKAKTLTKKSIKKKSKKK